MQFVTVLAHSFRKMIENGAPKGAKSDVIVQPTITPTITSNNYHFGKEFIHFKAL